VAAPWGNFYGQEKIWTRCSAHKLFSTENQFEEEMKTGKKNRRNRKTKVPGPKYDFRVIVLKL